MRRLRGFGGDVLLVAFIALDVVLVGAVVHHDRGSDATAAAGTASIVNDLSPTTPAATSGTGGSATTAATVSAAKLNAATTTPVGLLSVSSATAGWRATGGCTQKADLAATTNGGKTWQALNPPVAHILRISKTSATSGWVIGADAACNPTFLATADGGQTWTAEGALGQSWVSLPAGLRIPAGTTSTPCGANGSLIALAPASVTKAVVVCGKGVFRSVNGGISWHAAGKLPAGRPATAALVPGASGRGVLLMDGVAGCSGLKVLRTADTGASWQAGPCLAQVTPPASAALAADGSGLLVGTGGKLETTNSGKTWS